MLRFVCIFSILQAVICADTGLLESLAATESAADLDLKLLAVQSMKMYA